MTRPRVVVVGAGFAGHQAGLVTGAAVPLAAGAAPGLEAVAEPA